MSVRPCERRRHRAVLNEQFSQRAVATQELAARKRDGRDGVDAMARQAMACEERGAVIGARAQRGCGDDEEGEDDEYSMKHPMARGAGEGVARPSWAARMAMARSLEVGVARRRPMAA